MTYLRHFHSSSMLMGQYFYLVSVDSQQAVPQGKLGEAVCGELGLFQYLSDTRGPWAGDRLITIGDYMKDCPEGMLTETEEDKMNKWLSQQKADDQTYYHFVQKNYQIGRIANGGTITAPDDQIIILRNLSKRVYVREQDFLRYQQDEGVKAEETWGFDQLILINTAWSADPSCSMESDIIPGSWAGDQFDITELKSIDDTEWWDATKQEAKVMAKTVKAETERRH